MAIVMATLWVAAGAHCSLEALAGSHFLSCEQHAGAQTPPAHSEKECGDDGCWAIESGSYQAEKPIDAPARPLLALVAWALVVPDLSQEDSNKAFLLPSPAPPELPKAWQFSQRSALPPRAPSFLA